MSRLELLEKQSVRSQVLRNVLKRMYWKECIEKNVLKRMYWKECIEENLDSTIPVIDTKCAVKIPCKKA